MKRQLTKQEKLEKGVRYTKTANISIWAIDIILLLALLFFYLLKMLQFKGWEARQRRIAAPERSRQREPEQISRSPEDIGQQREIVVDLWFAKEPPNSAYLITRDNEYKTIYGVDAEDFQQKLITELTNYFRSFYDPTVPTSFVVNLPNENVLNPAAWEALMEILKNLNLSSRSGAWATWQIPISIRYNIR